MFLLDLEQGRVGLGIVVGEGGGAESFVQPTYTW